MKRMYGLFGLIGGALLVAGCPATSTRESASEVIGPEGGRIAIESGAAIEIPTGALSDPTEVSVERTDDAPMLPDETTPVGPTFAFLPHGLPFSSPATVVVPFDGDPSARAVLWTLSPGDGLGWHAVTGAERTPSAFRATVSHLSFFVVVDPSVAPADAGIEDGGPADASMDDGALPDAGIGDRPCIEAPFAGGEVQLPITIESRPGTADIAFLIDITGSMVDEIDSIRARLRNTIVPGIRDAIPDVQFAVATHGDFPVGSFGDSGDLPFTMMSQSSADVAVAEAALNAITLGNGLDVPESQVQALYHLATGEALEPWVSAADCATGIGHACFRGVGEPAGALPIVILMTDAPFHEGPGGADPYGSAVPEAATYSDAVAALNGIGARVIGLDSGSASVHLTPLAMDTGAVDVTGAPLVFHTGTSGEDLDTRAVEAVQSLASSIHFDVNGVAVPAAGDSPPTLEVVPRSAEPTSGTAGIDATTGAFLDVETGTRLTFDLVAQNDSVPSGAEPRVFSIEVVFRGDERFRVVSLDVAIVVPASDGRGCAAVR